MYCNVLCVGVGSNYSQQIVGGQNINKEVLLTLKCLCSMFGMCNNCAGNNCLFSN